MFTLYTHRNERLSEHPNLEGAKLSALFHVRNGAKITWRSTPHYVPEEGLNEYGFVNGQRRFRITDA